MKYTKFVYGLFLVFLFSCSDKETIMIFNEEKKELVIDANPSKINQPISSEISTFPSQSFTYDSLNRVNNISLYDSSIVMDFSYSNDTILASVKSNLITGVNHDTIYYILNNRNRIKYAVLKFGKKGLMNDPLKGNDGDSLTYTYSSEGFLEKMSYFIKTMANANYSEFYSQKYELDNGNIRSLVLKNGDRYKFTYDDNEHIPVSEFSYDMPKMLHQFSSYNPFALTLPAIYPYLGKTSKNNVVRIIYEWAPTGNQNNSFYSQINYSYRFNSNNLLTQMILNGTYLLSEIHFDGGSIFITYPAPNYKKIEK